jgi:ABC-type lipoprotein release transport system permease subunit
MLGSGKFWSWFWLGWMVFWMANLPLAMLTELKRSIQYLVFISIMALVLACAAAWQSSLTMRKVDPADSL